MTATEIKALADTGLCRLVHDLIAGPWDESRCRVCGWAVGSTHPMPYGDFCVCKSDNCSQRPVPQVRADAPPDCSRIGPLLNYISQRWQWEIGYDPGGWGEVKIFRMRTENDEDFATFRTTFEHVRELPRALAEAILLAGGR